MNLLRATLLLPALAVLVGSCSRPAFDDDGARFLIRRQWDNTGRVRFGFIDRTGRLAIPLRFDHVGSFSEGLAVAFQGDKQGYIDIEGRYRIVADGWSVCGDFHQGHAMFIHRDGKVGLIDTTGRVVIEPDYHSAMWFSEGLAPVATASRQDKDGFWRNTWGYVDRTGELVIPARFSNARPFSEGLAAAGLDDRYGYIDASGEFIIEPRYSKGGEFRNGLALVSQSGDKSFIDRSGTRVFEAPFDRVWQFSDGLALVEHDRLFGYIDTLGNWAIPPRFFWADSFSEGVAAVRRTDTAGYIDKSGEFVIVLPRDWCGWPFRDGLAFVDSLWRAGYIDHSGQFVWRTDHWW